MIYPFIIYFFDEFYVWTNLIYGSIGLLIDYLLITSHIYMKSGLT
jgi:hypothetical protein